VAEETGHGNCLESGIAAKYKRAPAAKVMHHAYLGGLLEHVISLCAREANRRDYPELDVDLLLTAAMLHDVGKLDELCYERAIGYTVEGQLLGHIHDGIRDGFKGHGCDRRFSCKSETVVQHLLISHHGQYEFGSPKLPMIREALAFHYLDDLDSKLAAARAALALDSGEPEWSAYSGGPRPQIPPPRRIPESFRLAGEQVQLVPTVFSQDATGSRS